MDVNSYNTLQQWKLHAKDNTNYDNTNYDEDDESDEEEDDYDDIPQVDVSNFRPPSHGQTVASFGLNRGRSSPQQRKAMGSSSAQTTVVHVCTNCGGETVKWHGRCPTCRRWNTLQEFRVQRDASKWSTTSKTAALFQRPIFQSGNHNNNNNPRPSSSWVDTSPPMMGSGRTYLDDHNDHNDATTFDNHFHVMSPPIPITHVLDEQGNARRGGGPQQQPQRIVIPDDAEMTNVLGGGLMKGSISLLGGTPGVGKSTLLLQAVASIAASSSSSSSGTTLNKSNNSPQQEQHSIWYVSGEETAEQIATRAHRLSLGSDALYLVSETHVDALAEQIVTCLEAQANYNQTRLLYHAKNLPPPPPSLLVVDSIQTMVCHAGGSSAAGGVTQMRECVALLLRLAKSTGIPILLVGHVTKNGAVAGPRTIEHSTLFGIIIVM